MNPNNINILLVEDSETDQQAFKHFVRSQQLAYQYTIASNVATARELISAMFFDVIIAIANSLMVVVMKFWN